jgi:lipopolysaccharide export system ATP-binding protein
LKDYFCFYVAFASFFSVLFKPKSPTLLNIYKEVTYKSLKLLSLLVQKGESVILDHIDLEFEGTCLGIVGANGAGKSTLFKCIMGLERFQSGKLLWDDHDLKPSQHLIERRPLGLAYLAQEHWLFSGLTVLENLVAVGELLSLQSDFLKKECLKSLTKVGLLEHQHQKVMSLSGGEKKRLEIARLLLDKPNLILLDEPFAGLDPKAIRLLKELIEELKTNGIQFIISDHQVTHVLDLCEDIYLLHRGKNLLCCSAQEFLSHALAQEVYL